jgi:copper chaperone CopZ
MINKKLGMKSFNITGLHCHHCVAKVKNTLEKAPGVQDVEVLQDQQIVKLQADPMPTLDELNQLLDEIGDYQLSV